MAPLKYRARSGHFSFDVPNAIELWKGLEANYDKANGCDFLTIPHNSNKAWGLTYSRYTWDGQQYSEDDWRLRQKREPLTEIFQIKGSQECALGVGATDEECAFAQVLDPASPERRPAALSKLALFAKV